MNLHATITYEGSRCQRTIINCWQHLRTIRYQLSFCWRHFPPNCNRSITQPCTVNLYTATCRLGHNDTTGYNTPKLMLTHPPNHVISVLEQEDYARNCADCSSAMCVYTQTWLLQRTAG
jgi:hypothetical protein